MVAVTGENPSFPAEFPIFVKSSSREIFFSLDVENEENFTYILRKRIGGFEVSATPLRTSGPLAFSYDGRSSFSLVVQQSHGSTELPREFSLGDVYPNPFNPTVRVRYSVPSLSQVTIQLFSVLGEAIGTLVDGSFTPGFYAATWDGIGHNGLSVSSGMYIVRMTARPLNDQVSRPAFSATRKIVFVK